MGRTLLERAWLDKIWRANEPWTVERKLHLGLAAIAVLGWTLAYTALTKRIDTPQFMARNDSAPAKISVSLATPQASPDIARASPAAR
jgi:hypothetical protein